MIDATREPERRDQTERHPLVWLFRVDGSVSLMFGLVTALFQHAVFSTAVDLGSAGATGAGDSLMEAMLYALSTYYAVVGGLLWALSRVPDPFATRLAALAGLLHVTMAVSKLLTAHRPWQTGNPWWDVGIHVTFAVAYLACLILHGIGIRFGRTS